MTETTAFRRPTPSAQQGSLFTVIALTGICAMMPVQMISLPSQMDVVDLWMLIVLIVFWSAFIFGRQSFFGLNSGYWVGMWLILFASVVSTFAAVDRFGAGVVLFKELYLFVGFVTLTTMLSQLNAREFRWVMWVWLATTVLHGTLILAEFVFPELFRFLSSTFGYSGTYDNYRPSGLYISSKAGNANKAAVFQLLGFVPLVMARPSRLMASVMGIVLFLSILATGSMGTTLAFIFGCVVALAAIALSGRHLLMLTRIAFRSALVFTVLGAVLFVLVRDNPVYQKRFEKIIVGRADRSSEGRFEIWGRGVETLQASDTLVFGIGPENFRDVDFLEKQLHNELLAFSVERGLLGALGLVVFTVVGFGRAILLLRIGCSDPKVGISSVVFLGVFASVFFVSLTHQIFHAREIWFVLATQECALANLHRVPAAVAQPVRSIGSPECWSGA